MVKVLLQIRMQGGERHETIQQEVLYKKKKRDGERDGMYKNVE